jgi:hypothetical protein
MRGRPLTPALWTQASIAVVGERSLGDCSRRRHQESCRSLQRTYPVLQPSLGERGGGARPSPDACAFAEQRRGEVTRCGVWWMVSGEWWVVCGFWCGFGASEVVEVLVVAPANPKPRTRLRPACSAALSTLSSLADNYSGYATTTATAQTSLSRC